MQMSHAHNLFMHAKLSNHWTRANRDLGNRNRQGDREGMQGRALRLEKENGCCCSQLTRLKGHEQEAQKLRDFASKEIKVAGNIDSEKNTTARDPANIS